MKEDPIHIGEAVFASALPPRQKEPLSHEDSTKLRKLLQSKNPEDLKVNSCDYCSVSLCCFGLFDDKSPYIDCFSPQKKATTTLATPIAMCTQKW